MVASSSVMMDLLDHSEVVFKSPRVRLSPVRSQMVVVMVQVKYMYIGMWIGCYLVDNGSGVN